MSVLVHRFANGVLLPVVSLGTWNGGKAETIEQALKEGYHAIDTAWVYHNEDVIGKVVSGWTGGSKARKFSREELKAGGGFEVVSEEEFHASFCKPFDKKPEDASSDRRVFVTSKVWVSFFTPDGIRQQVEEHLKNFNRSSVDLMLLHWPGHHVGFGDGATAEQQAADQSETRHACWAAMVELYLAGKIRVVGVSNYTARHINELVAWVKTQPQLRSVYPMVNQIECSVYGPPDPKLLHEVCKPIGCLITSYSSLGGSRHVRDNLHKPLVTELAEKYKVDPACIPLRWAIQQGMTVLPKSSTHDRVGKNLEVLTFELDDNDMDRLKTLNSHQRALMDPETIG